MDLTKALSERFEDAEFVEIRHVSKVYQTLL